MAAMSCLADSCLADSSLLMPCTHEEADTRMLLHVSHAARNGVQKVMIKTVDTDVLVIAVSQWHLFQLAELWIAIGVGIKWRFIAVHDLANSLGTDHCRALPFFHALTGCDTTSSFFGHGKKGAWETGICLMTSLNHLYCFLASQVLRILLST